MAPALGEAVGVGDQIVEQAKTGCEAEKKTKTDSRATPMTAAMRTSGVRLRSRKLGW